MKSLAKTLSPRDVLTFNRWIAIHGQSQLQKNNMRKYWFEPKLSPRSDSAGCLWSNSKNEWMKQLSVYFLYSKIQEKPLFAFSFSINIIIAENKKKQSRLPNGPWKATSSSNSSIELGFWEFFGNSFIYLFNEIEC